MLSRVASGQWCGFLFLFILLTSAMSKMLAGPPLNALDVPDTLRGVAASGSKFRESIALDLLSHACILALAGLLYVTFSPLSRSLALLGTLWRVGEGIIILFNEVNSILLLSVAQRYIAATGPEAVALEAVGRTLILSEEWGFRIGMALLALGHLMYALLFVSTRTLPVALGGWGAVASLLAAAGIWVKVANPNVSTLVTQASFAPLIPYEVVLGIWLLLRGGQIGLP